MYARNIRQLSLEIRQTLGFLFWRRNSYHTKLTVLKCTYIFMLCKHPLYSSKTFLSPPNKSLYFLSNYSPFPHPEPLADTNVLSLCVDLSCWIFHANGILEHAPFGSDFFHWVSCFEVAATLQHVSVLQSFLCKHSFWTASMIFKTKLLFLN